MLLNYTDPNYIYGNPYYHTQCGTSTNYINVIPEGTVTLDFETGKLKVYKNGSYIGLLFHNGKFLIDNKENRRSLKIKSLL